MKINIIAALTLLPVLANAQTILRAGNTKADIGVGKEWYPGAWRISPEIPHDTLKLKLYSSSEDVVFRTDKDSIKFKIKAGEARSFYVKLDTAAAPAHTVISAEAYKWDKIAFNKTDKREDIKLLFEKKDNAYYDSLRRLYPLDVIIRTDRSDISRVLSILDWTHNQWKHDGGNSPKGSDGISILNEARAGGRFPCFAYSIVLADQLMAYGYKARVVYLKTKDAETRKGSPGHVATEVYLNDLKKWVFLDGQFNVLPSLHGKFLNAIEFQKALSEQYDKVVLKSRSEVSKKGYTDFIYDYLYYFDTALDNRLIPWDKKSTVDGKRSIMLVPVGAPDLTKVGLWNSTVDYCVYTHSLKDFYAPPNN